MLRSSLVRTLTYKSQSPLAPVGACCCCAAANGESTSSTKTHASARTIFPPLSGLSAPVNFRPFQTVQQRISFRRYFHYLHSGRQPGTQPSSAHHCGPESHPLQRAHEPRRLSVSFCVAVVRGLCRGRTLYPEQSRRAVRPLVLPFVA